MTQWRYGVGQEPSLTLPDKIYRRMAALEDALHRFKSRCRIAVIEYEDECAAIERGERDQ